MRHGASCRIIMARRPCGAWRRAAEFHASAAATAHCRKRVQRRALGLDIGQALLQHGLLRASMPVRAGAAGAAPGLRVASRRWAAVAFACCLAMSSLALLPALNSGCCAGGEVQAGLPDRPARRPGGHTCPGTSACMRRPCPRHHAGAGRAAAGRRRRRIGRRRAGRRCAPPSSACAGSGWARALDSDHRGGRRAAQRQRGKHGDKGFAHRGKCSVSNRRQTCRDYRALKPAALNKA